MSDCQHLGAIHWQFWGSPMGVQLDLSFLQEWFLLSSNLTRIPCVFTALILYQQQLLMKMNICQSHLPYFVPKHLFLKKILITLIIYYIVPWCFWSIFCTIAEEYCIAIYHGWNKCTGLWTFNNCNPVLYYKII